MESQQSAKSDVQEMLRLKKEWLSQYSNKKLHYINNAVKGDVRRKWQENYTDDKFSDSLNLIEIAQNDVWGELDESSRLEKGKTCTFEQRKEWFSKFIENLEKENIGYFIFDHQGKCPHCLIKLDRDATKEEKEAILQYYFPVEAWEFVDTSLCGKHMIAAPYTKHFKTKKYKKLVKQRGGLIINVGDKKYKVIDNQPIPVVSSLHSGITAEIVKKIKFSDLLDEYGVKRGIGKGANFHCPFHNDKNPSLSINDEKGLYKCFSSACNSQGNMIDFVAKIKNISPIEALNILKKKAGILIPQNKTSSGYDSAFNDDGNSIKVDYNMIAKIFLDKNPFFYDKHRIWWMWNRLIYSWEMVDDVDIMVEIDRGMRWSATTASNVKNRILEALKREGRKNIPNEPKKTWIQFLNKIVDFETGESFEATPEYFITNPIPWEMKLEGETPNIDRIFKEWVGERYVQTLKEILAYSTITYMPIHRIFCLLGNGLNGKGSYMRLDEKLVGKSNSTSSSVERLIDGRFETSKLYKKTVVFIGEIDRTIFSRTALIKSLSGDDLLPVEFKGKDSFDSHNYAKPIIAANKLPDTSDKTKGFYRRWTIVDFPNEFSEKKDILSEIPDEEIKIFCGQIPKILRGLIERGEFTNDGTIANRESRYQERSSPIKKFIDECCNVGSTLKVRFSDLYNIYCSFLEEHGFDIPNKNQFGRLLTLQGFKSVNIPEENKWGQKTSVTYRKGIDIKS